MLTWDLVGEKFYETGISKGVFYDASGIGAAWNGLVSIDANVDTEVQAVHFDGVKINDIVTVGDFSATMRAYTYPDVFLPYEGIVETEFGFQVTEQPYGRFGLSYKTQIGDDVNGLDFNYKLHVLYNLTAAVSTKSYQTMTLETEPLEFEWNLTSIPEEIDGYRPTARLIFDTRKMDPRVLSEIETILYGSDLAEARLPPMREFIRMIKDWVLTPP